jgi:hypothetical protein
MKGFLKGDDIAVDEASAVRLDAGASECAQSGPIMTPATAKSA